MKTDSNLCHRDVLVDFATAIWIISEVMADAARAFATLSLRKSATGSLAGCVGTAACCWFCRAHHTVRAVWLRNLCC